MLNCSELNRARMVADPSEYHWSSYMAHANGIANQLLTDHDGYLSLGKDVQSRCAAYQGLFEGVIDTDTLQAIRESLNECRVLGDDGFKDQIEAVLKRSVRAGRKGRPRKSKKSAENRV